MNDLNKVKYYLLFLGFGFFIGFTMHYSGLEGKPIDKLKNQAMKTILVDAVNCFVVEKEGEFQIFSEMQELLERFPNPKIILTGANDDQIKMFSLDHMPWEVFTLKHNPEKTDPEYYKKMLNHFKLQPSEVVYFEHNSDAVISAQSVGITTYYYNKDIRDLAKLERFLLDNIQKTISKNYESFY